jgi:small Trp-rich protein
MILVWTGVILVVLKLLDVGPLIDVSWWWILAPLAAAFVWFEWVEKLVGLDRRKVDHLEWEKRRKERVAAQFPAPPGASRRR